MNPHKLGSKYNKIAHWWQTQHQQSQYGIEQVKKALSYLKNGGLALDVGCGCGGRMIDLMEQHKLSVTGIDVSSEMINLAKAKHPAHHFIHDDICNWESKQKYDFILAWDSLFHLPLAEQKPVLQKLCHYLSENGVLVYTFGDGQGEHTDTWRDDSFYYSSLGINENLIILQASKLTPVHVELDQYPEKHVFAIAVKRKS